MVKWILALVVTAFAAKSALAENIPVSLIEKSQLPIVQYTIGVADSGQARQINMLLQSGEGVESRKVTVVAGVVGTNICRDHATEPKHRRFEYFITNSQAMALIAMLQNAGMAGEVVFKCWNDPDGNVQMNIQASRVLPAQN